MRLLLNAITLACLFSAAFGTQQQTGSLADPAFSLGSAARPAAQQLRIRLRLRGAGWGALGRKHKHSSRVEPWEGNQGPYIFYNVQLRDGALIFHEPKEAAQHGHSPPPDSIKFNDGGEDVHLPVRRVTYDLQGPHWHSSCAGWLHKPAQLVSTTQLTNNLWHWLNDALMGIWSVRYERGWLANAPREGADDVALIFMNEHAWQSQWRYFLNYLSKVQLLAKDLEGTCFDMLVVDHSSLLDFYHTWESEPRQAARMDALAVFRSWMMRVERRHQEMYGDGGRPLAHVPSLADTDQSSRGVLRRSGQPPLQTSKGALPGSKLIADVGPESKAISHETAVASDHAHDAHALIMNTQNLVENSALTGWRMMGRKPRVTLASRTTSRGILNEREITDWIVKRYNVTLVVTDFAMSLWEAMDLMNNTDVFFGMHGAGMTNAIFLPNPSVCLQLYPYGFLMEDGHIMRGYYYHTMQVANGCKYIDWVNDNPADAFFRPEDFDDPDAFVAHPDASTPRPTNWSPPRWWIYQNTRVDMTTFGPKLHYAFHLAGIQPMGM